MLLIIACYNITHMRSVLYWRGWQCHNRNQVKITMHAFVHSAWTKKTWTIWVIIHYFQFKGCDLMHMWTMLFRPLFSIKAILESKWNRMIIVEKHPVLQIEPIKIKTCKKIFALKNGKTFQKLEIIFFNEMISLSTHYCKASKCKSQI